MLAQQELKSIFYVFEIKVGRTKFFIHAIFCLICVNYIFNYFFVSYYRNDIKSKIKILKWFIIYNKKISCIFNLFYLVLVNRLFRVPIANICSCFYFNKCKNSALFSYNINFSKFADIILF